MKASILSLFFLFLFLGQISSQDNVHIYSDFGAVANAISSGEGSFDVITSSEDGQTLHLLETDAEGVIIGQNTFEQNGENYSYVNGHFYKISEIENNGEHDIQYAKYDLAGNEIWQKTLDNPLDNIGVKFIETTDGNLLMSGITEDCIQDLYVFFLVKMDTDGNVIWQRNIPSQHIQYDKAHGYFLGFNNGQLYPFPKPGLSQMWATKDGGFLIQNRYGHNAISNPFEFHNWIKTDALGRVIWSDNYMVGSKLIAIPTPHFGRYLSSDGHADSYEDGSVVITYNTKLGTSQYHTPYLKKYAPDGSIAATKAFTTGFEFTTFGYLVDARSDGGFFWLINDGSLHQSNVGYFRQSFMLYAYSSEVDYPLDDLIPLNFQKNGMIDIQTGEFFVPQNLNFKDLAVVNNHTVAILGEVGEAANYWNPNASVSPFLYKVNLSEDCLNVQEDFVFFGSYLGRDYYLSNEKQSFETAKDMATAIGGTLIIPNNRGENDFLSSLTYGGESWTGISDAAIEGTFQTADDNDLLFQNFVDCEPDCVNSEVLDEVIFDLSSGNWELEETAESERFFVVEVDCEGLDQNANDLALFGPNNSPFFPFLTFPVPVTSTINLDIEYDLIIQNNSAIALNQAFDVKCFLSTDIRLDDTDIEIGVTNFAGLSANARDTFEINLNLPIGLEEEIYKVIYVVDESNEVQESTKGNNFFIPSGQIEIAAEEVIPEGADISIGLQGLSHLPNQGEDITFTIIVENSGTESIDSPFSIGVYRKNYDGTNSNNFDTPGEEVLNMMLWHEVELPNLPIGITEIPVAIPLSIDEPHSSKFWLNLYADIYEEQSEINEGNNHYIGFSWLTVKGDYAANLKALDIVPPTNLTYQQGENISFSFTLANTGLIAADQPFKVKVALTPDGWNFPSDAESTVLWFDNLGAESSQNIDVNVTVPGHLEPGEYRLSMDIDATDVILESEEWNTFHVEFITVTEVANADLTISNVTNLPSSAVQGEVVWFNFDLNNEGETVAAGEYKIAMYLNNTEDFDLTNTGEFLEIGIVPTGWTPVGTISDVGGGITIPEFIVPGEYFLILAADVDYEVSENDKTNNVVILPLQIGQSPDGFLPINCPENIEISAASGATSALVTWDESEIISDNCNDDLSEMNFGQCSGFYNGSYFPIGTETITYGIATSCNDYFDNIMTCEFTITVIEHPIFTTETNVEICQGETYEGTIYIENTILTDTLYFDDFDSVFVTNIQVLENFETTIFLQTCNPDEAGIFTQTFIASNGCDSIVTTQVNLLPTSEYNFFSTLCEGIIIEINGTIYDENNPTGTEILNNAAVNGCDSVIHISLQFIENYEINLFTTTCNPDEVGIFENNLISSTGCDSTVITQVDLLPSSEIDLFPQVCEGESIEINGIVYDENNPMGTAVLMNEFGCDSLVNVAIDWLENTEETVELTLIEGELYNGFPMEMDTTIIENYMAMNGCDSIVTILIDVQPVSTNEVLKTQFGMTVFPNPAQRESVFVQIKMMKSKDWKISIFNNLGQQVQTNWSQNWQTFGQDLQQIKLPILESGVYFIVLKNEELQLTEKVVIF